jgi:phospholipase B1
LPKMKRTFIISLSLFTILLSNVASLNLTEYVSAVEKLALDENFLIEYTKWSLELFSQPDYLYGTSPEPFPCSTKDMTSSEVPTSVHALRPGDIQCVAGMGDSLTAGMGAHAITPVGVLLENRGVSWSIGGDKSYEKLLTVPNVLRLYNPNLKGFSTKTSISFLNGQNAKNNGLNVAKSGARSYHMVEQADLLLSRLRDEKLCDWNNDWKLVTFFIGGNDLCDFCSDLTKHDPANFVGWVRDTLDKLYNANLPRTLVNLVLVLDIRGVKELKDGNIVCGLLHKLVCPCAAYPTEEQEKILNEWIPQYQQGLVDLVNSGRYDGRQDFTVVVQPFLTKTELPRKDNKVDFSYFAPDCFHFSGKGHSVSALSLWNNMFERVGTKKTSWHRDEAFECPTPDHPYIYTSKNSV